MLCVTLCRMVCLRAVLLLVIALGGLRAQSGFYLHDGDSVVFYGDSITEQRLYSVFAEDYAVTRFPNEKFTFVHSGWGGDRVSGGGGGPIDVRLQRDLIAYKPTVMTIMLGMNDAGYKPFDDAIFSKYEKGYEHILDSVRAALPGIRITAIQPSPYDDITRTPKFEGGYNAVLTRYAQFVKELAAKDGIDTADLNTPVVDDLKRALEIDPANAKRIIEDRVHPEAAGHLWMAEALLKAWHAPALVSDVELNVATHHIDQTAGATVADWNGMHWTATEKSLPMPILWSDPLTVLAVKSSDVLEALNQETLRVTGLTVGKWQLKIDDAAIGTFSSEELAQGINLARFATTPMMQQAMTVHDLTKQHGEKHWIKWRQLQVPPTKDAAAKDAAAKDPVQTEADMKKLDQEEMELVRKQHEAAQPKPHRFEIVAQS